VAALDKDDAASRIDAHDCVRQVALRCRAGGSRPFRTSILSSARNSLDARVGRRLPLHAIEGERGGRGESRLSSEVQDRKPGGYTFTGV
jgi:hypothetical protein